MKNIIIFILISALCSCNNSVNKSNELLSQISYGDTWELCIKKGVIQHTGGATAYKPYEWELTDSQITSYFPIAGVVFDNNNVIKELHLKAECNKNDSRGEAKVKNAFNYILRYYTQRYSGMKSKKINTKNSNSCIYNIGTEYTWETPYAIIKIEFYNCVHDSEICNRLPKKFPGVCVVYDYEGGTYTKVNIIRK